MSENEARIAALEIWSGPTRIEPLIGGISNLSYAVTDRSGKYVVRLTRDFPFHHVYRDREVMTARAAHAAGFAPEIVHAAPGLMVSRFIEGRVLTAADIRADIPRIAQFLRRFHTEMPERVSGPGFIFWVFHANRDYVRVLGAEGRAHDADHWLAINAELEAAQIPLPIRFGHHDLLSANLIDDGHRFWLIDYEYAGFGTALFDLANLSSNNNLSHAQSEGLLEGYFGASLTPGLRRAHAAMEAASLLREALWSLVSATQLKVPGVDYQAYAEANFVKFDSALRAYRERLGG
jgi:thiamine kinase-like enzyme